MSNKILIMGLGNPGSDYKNTPHNAGYEIIDELTGKLKSDQYPLLDQDRDLFVAFKLKLEDKEIIIAKNKTFMNNSGSSLVSIDKYYGPFEKDSIWIIHDDIDIPINTIRTSFGSSAAGHRGIEDIINKTETKEFWRFRVGVRPENMPLKRSSKIMQDFVVNKPKRKTKKELKGSYNFCADIILNLITSENINITTTDYQVK